MDYGIIGEIIGSDDLYIAEVVEDSLDAFITDKPQMLAPSASIAEATAMNQVVSHYSNKAYWVYNSEGLSTLTLVLPYLDSRTEAYLLGKLFDDTTGRMVDSGQLKARYFALGFRSPMSDGNYTYVWWAKGAFSIPSQNRGQTKTETTTPQQLTMTYAAISTIHLFEMPEDEPNGIKKIQGDTTETAFDPTFWFDAVQLPPDASGATYAVTVQPDNAANGSITVNPTGAQKEGTVLTLTATPESGFTFDHWSSDNGGMFADATSANTTFTMPADAVTITAHFS